MPIWMTYFGSSSPSSTARRKGRAVVIFLAVISFVGGVGVGVEMDHANRAILGNSSEDRQGDQVIATDRQRCDTGLCDWPIEFGDQIEAFGDVHWIDQRVAHIGDFAELERIGVRDVMDAADQARLIPQSARPVARARPIGDGTTEVRTHHGNIRSGRFST